MGNSEQLFKHTFSFGLEIPKETDVDKVTFEISCRSTGNLDKQWRIHYLALVERTFSWLNNCHFLSKDYEILTATAKVLFASL